MSADVTPRRQWPGEAWARRNQVRLIVAAMFLVPALIGVSYWLARPQNDAGSAEDACHDLVSGQVDHITQWYGTEHEGERDHVSVTGHLYASTDVMQHQEAYHYTCSMSWDGSSWNGSASVG